MIIQSLLDTDLYKFTMQQTVLHRFASAMVEYHFRCRTPGVDLVQHLPRIEREIDHLCTLGFRPDELDYLRSLRYISEDYVAFLKTFRLPREYVQTVAVAERPGEIDIVIKGPWFYTILFEIPVLAIVNQTYFEAEDVPAQHVVGQIRLDEKIAQIEAHPQRDSLRFSDFGTRRRFSRDWHRYVVQTLQERVPDQLHGTSNVLLAKDLGLTPIGTMAHEYLQACQALGPNLSTFQRFAYETWAQEFRGDLGIALTDVINLDAFLRDFDLYFCKLFDGARHDSGDPFQWGDRLVAHYQAHRIDPMTKNLVFSDGLNVPKMLALHAHFHGRARTSYGIGTDLTNDLGPRALQIVLKMTRCNGRPVAKLSDSQGKTMCDDAAYVTYLRACFANPDDVLARAS